MEPTSEHIEQYRTFLTEVLHRSKEDMQHIRFDKKVAQHLVVACLYATIIQSAKECLLLLSGPTITTGAVLRGILESWADLSALIKDASYVERMLATFYVEKQRLLRHMIGSPENPMHEALAKHFDPVKELEKVTAELKIIEDRGHKRLNNADRFRAAGMDDIYQTVYWQLCLQSHNTASALEYRHILVNQDDFEVMLCNENSTSELINYFDPLTALLIDCAVKVHSFLETGVAPKYEQRRREFQALRAAVIASSAK